MNTLGHNHPVLTAALRDQVGKLIHTSNIYQIPLQEALGEKLAALSGLDKTFFCNSGLEANEAAIKLARLYGHHRGIESPEIVVYEKAFHGRSLATCRPPATARCRRVSSRWYPTSCAPRSTTSRHWS